MDTGTMFTIGAAIAGAATGFFGGRGARQYQSDAIAALSARVDDQQKSVDTIPGLKEEIRILTNLVTQRAEVERVIEIVTRIEEQLNAQARQS